MRKAINGLVAIVEGQMALVPFSANLFVFCNTQHQLFDYQVRVLGRQWVCTVDETPGEGAIPMA